MSTPNAHKEATENEASGQWPKITSVDELLACANGAVLVDRIGVAWQVIELGADWSAHRGERDTRRAGFVQAGNHVTFEARQLASVLPMRLVDRGTPEPIEAHAKVEEKLILFAGEIPNGVRS